MTYFYDETQGLKVEVLPSTFDENLEKSAFSNPGGTLFLSFIAEIFVIQLRSNEVVVDFIEQEINELEMDLIILRTWKSVVCSSADYAKETATHKAIEVASRTFEVRVVWMELFTLPRD